MRIDSTTTWLAVLTTVRPAETVIGNKARGPTVAKGAALNAAQRSGADIQTDKKCAWRAVLLRYAAETDCVNSPR